MREPENILRILKETKKAVEKEDNVKLKDLSNQTIHSASIYQDADNILVAVIIYSLSKIIERTNYKKYKRWPKFFRRFIQNINLATKALEKNDIDLYRKRIQEIRKEINLLHGNFKKHIENVFKKAEINKASRIYEHGISMEQTAKLLGISLWDLIEYSGETGIADINLNITLDEKIRIKNALKMFEK